MSAQKVALVTGASRGIGRQIALGLADSGHKVIAVSRSALDISDLSATQKSLITSITGDVSDVSFVERLEKQVSKEHGVVQILINAAGVFGPIDLIHNTDPAEWTRTIIHPGDVQSDMWADIKAKAEALGEVGKDYKAWVDWVDQTGGDDPKKAMDLVLKLVSAESDSVNGRFCWIDQPLQAPIPSWEDPVDARPWG